MDSGNYSSVFPYPSYVHAVMSILLYFLLESVSCRENLLESARVEIVSCMPAYVCELVIFAGDILLWLHWVNPY